MSKIVFVHNGKKILPKDVRKYISKSLNCRGDEAFPDEIWIQILITFKKIMSLCTVSKKINNIVTRYIKGVIYGTIDVTKFAKMQNIHMRECKFISKLILNSVKHVNYEGIKHLTDNIVSLTLINNCMIKDIHILAFTKLTELNISQNRHISDHALKVMTTLKTLILTTTTDHSEFVNYKITDNGVSTLINLTTLMMSNGVRITSKGLSSLTNLTNLDIGYNHTITDLSVKHLVKLKTLSLFDNLHITTDGISNLINLTSLNLDSNDMISDEGLIKLVTLVDLNLSYNHKITDDAVMVLTNITNLNLSCNHKITNKSVVCLTKISTISLTTNKNITHDSIMFLTNITNLNVCDNFKTRVHVDCIFNIIGNIEYLTVDAHDLMITHLPLFTNLKSLTIKDYFHEKYFLTNEDILSLSRLQHLDLYIGHNIDKKTLMKLNLKSLTLNGCKFTGFESVSKIRGIDSFLKPCEPFQLPNINYIELIEDFLDEYSFDEDYESDSNSFED
jgi:internalin A